MQKKYRYRSAISGLTVTKEYALANPDITVKEAIENEKTEKTEITENLQLERDEPEIERRKI